MPMFKQPSRKGKPGKEGEVLSELAMKIQPVTASHAEEAQKKTTLYTCFFIVFVDLLGGSILMPILPAYIAVGYQVDSGMVGIVLTVFNLANFLNTLVAGRLSDRFGRKPMLLASLFTTALGSILTGVAPSFGALIAIRFFAGSGGSSPSTAQAIISDISTKAQRPRHLAFLGLSIAMAFVFGPLIGSSVAAYGLSVPFFLSGCLSTAALLIALLVLPETQPSVLRKRAQLAAKKTDAPVNEAVEGKADKVREQAQLEGAIQAVDDNATPTVENAMDKEKDKVAAVQDTPMVLDAQSPPPSPSTQARYKKLRVALVCVGLFFTTLGMNAFTSFFPLYARTYLGINAQSVGIVFSVAGVIAIIQNGLVFPYEIKFMSFGAIAALGTGLMAIGLLVFGSTVTPLWLPLLFLAVVMVGSSSAQPTTPAILSSYSTPATMGFYLSLGQMSLWLGNVIAPVLFGAIYRISPAGCFYAAGGSCALSCAIYIAYEVLRTVVDRSKVAEEKAKQQQEEEEVEKYANVPVVPPTAADIETLGTVMSNLLLKRGYVHWPDYVDEIEEFWEMCIPTYTGAAALREWKDTLYRQQQSFSGFVDFGASQRL